MDDGELSSPTGITLDKDGNIYVADTDNHSIQKFDKDRKVRGPMGRRAWFAGRHVLLSPRFGESVRTAHVYVADSGNNRVQKFDLDGNRA